MRVQLKPGKLDRLDEVTIAILDETGRDHWRDGLPQGFAQEAEAFLCEEYRLAPGGQIAVRMR